MTSMLFLATWAAVLPLAAQDVSAANFPFTGHVATSRLNVRILPSTDPASTIVAVLSEGEQVTVVEEKDGFFGIQAPKGAWTWVNSKSLEISGDAATVKADAPVRSDSRVTAPVIARLTAGSQVKVIQEHLGWTKIDAGSAVHFWVGKRYVSEGAKTQAKGKASKPSHEVKAAPVSAVPDSGAQAKMKEAEDCMNENDEFWKSHQLDKVDYRKAAGLWKEAADLAKDPQTKGYCLANARIIEKVHYPTDGILIAKGIIKEQERQLEDILSKRDAARAFVKSFAFRGYVDTTGATLKNRPGTHKLVTEDKSQIICFLKVKDDDPRMLEALNAHYEKYIGVNGTVILSPVGWPGYSVVVVDELQDVKPEEAMYLLGDKRSSALGGEARYYPEPDRDPSR